MSPVILLPRRYRRGVMILSACWLMLLTWFVPMSQPAWADSLLTRDAGALDSFRSELQELQATTPPLSGGASARLQDLERLAEAIGVGDESATVSNASSHNLALFARYKKESPEQVPHFYVLAPGHTSDDDYDALALYIPSGVSVNWEGGTSLQVSSAAQVVPLLPSEQLKVSDSVSADEATLGYDLSLPALRLVSSVDGVSTLPNLTQQSLDNEPESAPLD